MSGVLLDDGKNRVHWSNRLNRSYLKIAIIAYISIASVGVMLNIGRALERRTTTNITNSNMVSRSLPSSDTDCPLKCGNHGVCQFRNRDEKSEPACLCEDAYGTFPEKRCGFDTASTIESNLTVSKCTLGDGRVFQNHDGPCSYRRVGMVNVACASWLGGGFGADWFLMLDVHGCKNCTIDGKHGIPYNRGYGAAGFFALITVDYLTIGWWVNSIRILVSRSSSIPYWDALGFLHSDTINHNLING